MEGGAATREGVCERRAQKVTKTPGQRLRHIRDASSMRVELWLLFMHLCMGSPTFLGHPLWGLRVSVRMAD